MKKFFTSVVILSSLSLAACSGGSLKQPEDWNKKERGVAAGAVGGAALGGVVGSQSGNAGTGALIGGTAGAVTGGVIGNELDKNERRR